ncbi:hypothetical protein [Jiangella gansuensis]|uniref:hypothetical protein n=1 Tax=Jiangella gansuensis TaxID=281473 RepID=UPI00047CE5C2|nr:hypothetical protein [Jiangella gansuensis]
MNTLSVREILEQVADGRLDPTRAAVLLDQADGAAEAPLGTLGDDDARGGSAAGGGGAGAGGGARAGAGRDVAPPTIERIQVRATSRRLVVTGDPSVSTVAVDGQHTVRRDGTTLHITGETELVPTEGAFTLLAGGRWRDVAARFQNAGQMLDLRVRVNPELAVTAEAIAGSLQVSGVPVLEHIRVTAGSLRVRDLESSVDLLVQAGSAQVETRQLAGHSRMRCESGSLQLTLLEGSDVRVRSDVQLGRLRTVPDRVGRDRDRDVVIGTGAAEIDAEVVMGDVTIILPGGAGR